MLAVVTGHARVLRRGAVLRPLAAEDAAWLSGGARRDGAARHCRRLRAQNWRVIDLHSHLLPGLDDGPADVAGSVALAAEVAAAGRAHAGRDAAPALGLPGRRRARARRGAWPTCRRGCTRSGSRSSSSPAARSTCCGRRARPTRSCAPPATAAAAPTCWSRRPTASCRGCSRTCCSGSACAASGSCSRTRSATRPSSATPRGSCGWSRATCSCSSPRARSPAAGARGKLAARLIADGHAHVIAGDLHRAGGSRASVADAVAVGRWRARALDGHRGAGGDPRRRRRSLPRPRGPRRASARWLRRR